eukprot:1183275-Prorocentrum_minimum.AAC.1
MDEAVTIKNSQIAKHLRVHSQAVDRAGMWTFNCRQLALAHYVGKFVVKAGLKYVTLLTSSVTSFLRASDLSLREGLCRIATRNIPDAYQRMEVHHDAPWFGCYGSMMLVSTLQAAVKNVKEKRAQAAAK